MNGFAFINAIRRVTDRAVVYVIGHWYLELRVPDDLVDTLRKSMDPQLLPGMRVDVKPLGHQAQYCHSISFLDVRR